MIWTQIIDVDGRHADHFDHHHVPLLLIVLIKHENLVNFCEFTNWITAFPLQMRITILFFYTFGRKKV